MNLLRFVPDANSKSNFKTNIMKKFITLCVLVFLFALGTNGLTAQEKYKQMDEVIKVEAEELQKILNLDKDQTALLARSMFAKEKAYADIATNKKLDEKEARNLKEKVDMNFKSRLQDILDEEQFATYSAYQAKKMVKKE